MKHTFLSIISFFFIFSAYAQTERQIELNKDSQAYSIKKIHTNFKSNPKSTYLNEDFRTFNAWTVIDGGDSNHTWEVVDDYNGQTLDGTPFAFVNSDAAYQYDMDEILELTNGIDVSNATTLYISFDHFMWDWDSNPTPTQGDVDIWDGTEWITIYTADNQDIGTWGNPDHQEIEITDYINDNLKVRFHYTANWDFWWAVDNCIIFSRDAHDLVVQNKFLTWLFKDDSKTPSAEILNFGLESENDYDVNYIIYNNNDEIIYNETINVTQTIDPDETNTVYFPSWTGTIAETYKDTIIVTVADDGNLINNIIGGEIEVIGEVQYDGNTIYGWNGSNPDNYTTKISLQTGEVDDMQLIDTWYWTCATYIDGRVYGINFNNNNQISPKLHYLNNNGIPYEIGDIEGMYLITGMAHDITTGKTYITNFNYSGIYQLFELDLEDLTTTYIGSWGSTTSEIGMMYAIACDNNGLLYGLTKISDEDARLFAINKTDAEVTEIGIIGVEIIYPNHDLSFDRKTNILYASLLEETDGAGIYTIDTENGEATLLHDLNLDYPITACAVVPTVPVNINELNSNTSIYPNPSNGIFTINDLQGFDNHINVEIIDIAGRKISNFNFLQINSKLTIDLSNHNSGIYIVKLSNNQQSINYQVVIK